MVICLINILEIGKLKSQTYLFFYGQRKQALDWGIINCVRRILLGRKINCSLCQLGQCQHHELAQHAPEASLSAPA